MANLMWILVGLVLLFGAYVRLAPSDPGRWHVMQKDAPRDKDFEAGAIRVVEAEPNGLARIVAIADAWPRTKRLAGSVEEGMVTYVTRSKLWGFPDYTTIYLSDGQLVLYARLRFGRGDMGVNRARLEAWQAQM